VDDRTKSLLADERQLYLLGAGDSARKRDSTLRALYYYTCAIRPGGPYTAEARHMRAVTFTGTPLLGRLRPVKVLAQRDFKTATELTSEFDYETLGRIYRDESKVHDYAKAMFLLDMSQSCYQRTGNVLELTMSQAFAARRQLVYARTLRDKPVQDTVDWYERAEEAEAELRHADAFFALVEHEHYRMYNLPHLIAAQRLLGITDKARHNAREYRKLTKRHGGVKRRLQSMWLLYRLRI
jgi:hypothetical protein